MAKTKGGSAYTVQKFWKANDLKPHLKRTFNVSSNARFEEKFWDVIGLYLNPPARTLVLYCDELRANVRPWSARRPRCLWGRKVRTGTHDYVRHGTITLFAALSYLDGKIFRQTAPQHTHREWLGFLKKLDRETPADLSLHLIIDNYAMHKQPTVMKWIASRNKAQERCLGTSRIYRHFIPRPIPG